MRGLERSLIAVADTDTVAVDTTAADTTPTDARTDTIPRPDTLRRDTLDRTGVPSDTTPTDTLATDLETRRAALGGGDFPEPDDYFQELSALEGYRVVEYRARRVDLDVERETVRLEGEAQANYTASVLEADSITYRAGVQFISARGNIKLASQGMKEVTSDSILYYDVSQFKGTILDARTAFAERGAEWYVRGTATPRGETTVFVEAGSFTSCEYDEPHYFFKAGQIKVVSENVIVAWPVTLYIQNVPVIWLPFFAQDIRPGRRSGFLPPRFGFNDILGGSDFNRQISDFGYYFALNPFMDAQVTVDWFSGNFTRLNGAFRYKVLKRFFQGNVLGSYSFGDNGNSLEFRASHDQEIGPSTDFRVKAAFVQDTRLFQDQSFDPRQQTQTIDSDLGFNHRFPFASVSLSARRRQFLGDQTGRVDLTLPQLRLNFSPVTLFRAPAARAGPFNNLTLSGSADFSRQSLSREAADDQTTTRGGAATSLRLGSLTLSGNGNVDDRGTTPVDSLGMDLPSTGQTTVTYGGAASYQLDLMGSTTLRPNVSVNAAAFRSTDTDGFVSAPSRLSVGASLSTDVFAFLPSFGPFTRIRHKVSPRFSWTYSPEVSVADSLLEIPGFPGTAANERHTLSISINQTFEAKVRRSEPEPEEEADDAVVATQPREGGETGDEGPGEEPTAEDETGAGTEAEEPAPEEDRGVEQEQEGAEAAAQDTTLVEPGQEDVDTVTVGRGRFLDQPFKPRPRSDERNVVLLSINSSSLDFDFTKKDEPLLVTDRWRHGISSDLLRGLSLNLTLDLFEGTGEDRKFNLFLQELTGSFSFSSQRGLAGMFGLGDGSSRRTRDPGQRIHEDVDSRYRLSGFEDRALDPLEDVGGAGPWTLSLVYSLRRVRADESGDDRQSLGARLALRPTPNWRLQWRTLYDLSEGEFGEHLVTLDRDLHRWQASFVFSRAPNGNFLFSVRVNLRDAPDLKLDYDEQILNR